MDVPWRAVQGCVSDPTGPPPWNARNPGTRMGNFLFCVARWMAVCLHSFFPSYMEQESRAYREYLETHNPCWVDTVDVVVVPCRNPCLHETMSLLKLVFLQNFSAVQLKKQDIRIDVKVDIQTSVENMLKTSGMDVALFEWKPLVFQIDLDKEMACFFDPTNGKRSAKVYYAGDDDDYPADPNSIPWLVI